jgi:Cupin-like domain/F-box-like
MSSHMPPHPVGVRPVGNMYSEAAAPCIRRASLGPHLSALPDSILCRLLSLCCPDSLLSLALTSRMAYAFARDEDLWRALTLGTFGSCFKFGSSWRETYAATERLRRMGPEESVADVTKTTKRPRTVRVEGVYSDVLFHKWRCATAVMQGAWLEHDNVERIDGGAVSSEEFREQFEKPGVPVVVTGIVPQWPASSKWSKERLRETCAFAPFIAGGYDFAMRDYLDYSDRIEGRCDQPLYLFDSGFARKAPQLAADYTVPDYFADDLFQHLGEDMRPHYRWLIVGPKHSGSSFHKDPNATSAWNACVYGSKKWILFPPNTPPPGVHPTADESDVTAPLSVMEWYLNFYDEAREAGALVGAVECIVRAGELVFVPAGWWHCVVNLEWSAAVTQNYVSSVNFARVAHWLRTRPEQVSGCRDAAHARHVASSFVDAVLRARPDLADSLASHERKSRRGGPDSGIGGGEIELEAKRAKRAVGLWDSLRVASGEAGGERKQFTFGLG